MFLLPCVNIYGQNKVLINELTSKNLVSAFCNVDTVIFKRNSSISVALYRASNVAGSAGIAETDQASNKFFIATTDGDEVPEQHLFTVGNFYNPKVVKFDVLKNRDYLLTIEYGFFKNRKKVSFNISLSKVTVTMP